AWPSCLGHCSHRPTTRRPKAPPCQQASGLQYAHSGCIQYSIESNTHQSRCRHALQAGSRPGTMMWARWGLASWAGPASFQAVVAMRHCASRRQVFGALAGVSASAGASLLAACSSLALPTISRQPRATPTIAATPGPSPTPVPSLPLLPPARDLPGRLLVVADANIWLLERGHSTRLTPDRISRQPSWSHDGRKIAHSKLSTSGSDLWIMDADGSSSEQLTDN